MGKKKKIVCQEVMTEKKARREKKTFRLQKETKNVYFCSRNVIFWLWRNMRV